MSAYANLSILALQLQGHLSLAADPIVPNADCSGVKVVDPQARSLTAKAEGFNSLGIYLIAIGLAALVFIAFFVPKLMRSSLGRILLPAGVLIFGGTIIALIIAFGGAGPCH